MSPPPNTRDPNAPDDDDDDDDAAEDRRAILARRAVFMASALAGLALGEGCSRPAPQPCLSAIPNRPETPPEPCLSIPVPRPDAGQPLEIVAPADAGAPLPPVDPPPVPCLSVAVPDPTNPPWPRPQPCLSPPPVRRDAGVPQPCLRMVNPRPEPPVVPPQPCLSPVRNKGDDEP